MLEFFELHSEWWELPLRAAIIYSVLLLLLRVSGRRTVGQFTPFDLLVVMLLSESVSSGLNAFAFLEADGQLSVLKESDGKVLSGSVRSG